MKFFAKEENHYMEIKKYRFIDNGLAGDVYYPHPNTGIKPKTAGMYLFGFPSFIGPIEVTTALVADGLLSFQPHYYGSYDSDGLFSPNSVVETSKTSQALFDRGYITRMPDGSKFELPEKLEILIGHSFGCFAAIRAVPFLKTLKVLVLLAPTIHYSRTNPDFGVDEDGVAQIESVRISNPKTYRLASAEEWRVPMLGQDPIPNLGNHPTLEEVVVVVGENDKYFDLKALRANLPLLIRGYCGEKTEYTFLTLPGVAHAINSGHLEKQNGFDFSGLLRKHKLANV
jgi:hypothetical protein